MSEYTRRYALIVAGGSGSRMNSTVPKQFMLLHGEPVLIHTLRCFTRFNPGIKLLVAIHKDWITTVKDLLQKHSFEHPVKLISGGGTRFHSVKNGLDAIDEDGIVGIHDAARPLVSPETLKRAYNIATEKGNAIPVIELSESIRQLEGNKNQAADRNLFRIVQTPQCFRVSLIKKAFEQEYLPAFTDDSTVLENTGVPINLVEGNRENIKITVPADLVIAEALLRSNNI